MKHAELIARLEVAWALGLAGGIVLGWCLRPVVERIERALIAALLKAEGGE